MFGRIALCGAMLSAALRFGATLADLAAAVCGGSTFLVGMKQVWSTKRPSRPPAGDQLAKIEIR